MSVNSLLISFSIQKYLEKRQKLTKSTIVSTPPKLPDLKAKLSEPESDSKRPITRSMSSLIDEADKIRTKLFV